MQMVFCLNYLFRQALYFLFSGEALGAIGCAEAVPILEKYKDDKVIEVGILSQIKLLR
jgi:hypothetical protein